MRAEDLDAVLDIERASFSSPWTGRHFLDEIDSPCSFPVVAVTPDRLVAGYLCLKQVLDEAEILDVAVNPELRGRGVGVLQVEEALAFCREKRALSVCLEVRAGNGAAIALYLRLGFRQVGLRKRYYHDGEDALLMTYTFTEHAEEYDAV